MVNLLAGIKQMKTPNEIHQANKTGLTLKHMIKTSKDSFEPS